MKGVLATEVTVKLGDQDVHIWSAPTLTNQAEDVGVKGLLPLLQKVMTEVIHLPIVHFWNVDSREIGGQCFPIHEMIWQVSFKAA